VMLGRQVASLEKACGVAEGGDQERLR
jgi:hypothetical protein